MAREGQELLAEALPLLEQAAGSEVTGRVGNSPNAYDDIVGELSAHDYHEIIRETPPSPTCRTGCTLISMSASLTSGTH